MVQNGQAEDLKERPISELFSELSKETVTLFRQELDLAKAELAETGKKAGMGAGLFGAAGVIGFLAAGALTACFILALATFMPGWVAALIVAAIYGAVAAFLGLRGKEKIQQATPPIPQTQETIKEDIEWAKHPTR